MTDALDDRVRSLLAERFTPEQMPDEWRARKARALGPTAQMARHEAEAALGLPDMIKRRQQEDADIAARAAAARTKKGRVRS